jgi:phosphatidylserine/phosphatidylglycerophosphate/cardiolipin synthase-like enzyme
MKPTIAAFANCDDVFVVWQLPARLAGCLGFAIFRKWIKGAKAGTTERLENHIGFANEQNHPFQHQPSNVWPFQRFNWTDHGLATGSVLQYQVVPVMNKNGKLVEDTSSASPWTKNVSVAPGAEKGLSCYFNRGLVMSQFVSKIIKDVSTKGISTLKDEIKKKENKLRDYLAGELGKKLDALLDDVRKTNGSIFAALFELNDDDLEQRLIALKSRAHLVLANGSIEKPKKGSGKLAKLDENAPARAALKSARTDVHDRMCAPKGLGHNKFMVICDKAGKPQSVWTGSTNWASTGLCTQINNGILIEDAKVAQLYLDQWNRLKEAGNDFSKKLVAANSQIKSAKVGNVSVNVWFTRTSGDVDLGFGKKLIAGAKDGILFLMFMPGNAGLLQSIQARLPSGMYIQGVVSSFSPPPKSAPTTTGTAAKRKNPRGKLNLQLVSHEQGTTPKSLNLDIIQPQGINKSFSGWAAEVTRNEFLSPRGIGHAIVHSKLIVLDPFGDKPVVMTGSHNLSKSASEKNDENLVIIQNCPALAQAYAVNVLSVYQHYRWRASLAAGGTKFSGLRRDDTWQKSAFSGAELKGLEFWMKRAKKQ